MYVGATPVFIDVDSQTWNIAIKEIEKNITKKTKAILPVHLYGNPCSMDEVMKIAKKYNLFVIEDATESLGAQYKGIHTGTFGDMGCFSFNGNKIITTGGGGMLVGNNEQHLRHIRFLVNQARDETRGYYHPEIGFNYRMTNIEAALGLAQLERLEKFVEKKLMFNQMYREELGSCKNIHFQEEYSEGQSSFWLSCVVIDGDRNIEEIQAALHERGIPVRRIFMPIVGFPPYKKYQKKEYSNAQHIYERGLCLPSSVLNSETDIQYVCKILKEMLG